MVKILITTIQVNFCAASQNLPELSLLKFLPLTYHHSHFLAATLDFTSFFTIAFLRAAHFFYSLAVLDLIDYYYLVIIHKYIYVMIRSLHCIQTSIVDSLAVPAPSHRVRVWYA